jgi:sortase A
VETQVVEAKVNNLKEITTFGLPVKLKIPSIKVDSKIESLGLTKDGAVDAPAGPSNTGWYNLGPYPGDIGNAIIDGHSGFSKGPAVFDDLYKIKLGDKVYVENDKGESITFSVSKIMKYDPNVSAEEVFFSTDGKSHLNLITCTGFWNKILKSHSSRLVVFTDRE